MSKRIKNSLAGNSRRQSIFRQVNAIIRREQSENVDYAIPNVSDTKVRL